MFASTALHLDLCQAAGKSEMVLDRPGSLEGVPRSLQVSARVFAETRSHEHPRILASWSALSG
jgi:hypothetical protein